MEFTRNWTRKCLPHWNAHLVPLVGTKPLTYLEIGVWEGRSALWILQNILTGPADRYFGIDPWELTQLKSNRFPRNEQGEVLVRAIEQRARNAVAPFGSKAKLHRRFSGEALRDPIILKEIGRVDIAYIDGDHNPLPCLEDSQLTWPLVPVGGIVIWDDMKDPDNHGANLFLRTVPGRFDVLFSDYQLGVRKTKE